MAEAYSDRGWDDEHKLTITQKLDRAEDEDLAEEVEERASAGL